MRLLHCILLIQFLILADHYRTSTALRGDVEVVNSSNKNYTFVVSIQNKATGNVVCAGSLITKKHVLTTKHCLTVHPRAELEVVAGDYDRTKGKKYQIAESTSFHQWLRQQNTQNKTKYYSEDIDVLTLAKPVDGDVNLARITDKQGYKFTGQGAEILGWGQTDDGNQNKLRRGIVELLSASNCKFHVHTYNGDSTYELSPAHICSSSSYMERLSRGDEGGPMVVKGELIGIALHPIIRDGVDHEYEPNLHLGVYPYRDFINSFVSAEAGAGKDDDSDEEEEGCE